MQIVSALLWGLLGSAVAEALNLSAMMRPAHPRGRWRRPWGRRSDRPVVFAAVLLRLFIGCGLTAPLAVSGNLTDELSAFLAGLAAPLLISRIFQVVPMVDPGQVQVPLTTLPAQQGGPETRTAGVTAEAGGANAAQ